MSEYWEETGNQLLREIIEKSEWSKEILEMIGEVRDIHEQLFQVLPNYHSMEITPYPENNFLEEWKKVRGKCKDIFLDFSTLPSSSVTREEYFISFWKSQYQDLRSRIFSLLKEIRSDYAHGKLNLDSLEKLFSFVLFLTLSEIPNSQN